MPIYLFVLWQSGKPLTVIHGANGPLLLNTIRKLLKKEIAVLKGQGEREVVLLESLVKPEEVLEPDEDLDDIEGQMNNLGKNRPYTHKHTRYIKQWIKY
ncbi:hypothetical protein SK128_017796 [Halocaridina rubra]|uniref:Uncharacterized protein n=1 Tax=Halocaridina rubra TaxID=373956 RepID=A0AAN9A300_HALRR